MTCFFVSVACHNNLMLDHAEKQSDLKICRELDTDNFGCSTPVMTLIFLCYNITLSHILPKIDKGWLQTFAQIAKYSEYPCSYCYKS